MSSPPEDTPPEPISNDIGKKTKRRSMLPKIGGGSSSKSPSKLSSSSKGRRRRPTLDRDNSAVAMGKLTNDPREEMRMTKKNTADTVDNVNNSGHKKRSKEKVGSRRDKGGGDNRVNMMRDMQQNSKLFI